MASTYYSSLSGMLAASYGLQNTSNNIANMQSPGFKRSDVFYSSLGNGNDDQGAGQGVCISGKTTNFSEGRYLPGNSPTDLAVVGRGFFVIKLKNNELVYTRDGQFQFNQEGILIDHRTGGQVQGYDKAGSLVPIHKNGPKISTGKTSHAIDIKGQFILQEKSEEEQKSQIGTGNKYQNITFKLEPVYDVHGKPHTITVEFESTKMPPVPNPDGSSTFNDRGTSWDLVNVSCDDAAINIKDSFQHLEFASIGSGAVSDSHITFNLNGAQEVRVNFGSLYDDQNDIVMLKTGEQGENTQIEVYKNDGYATGKQYDFSFDENGQIGYHYDNGQTIQGIYVGLAYFDDLEHNLLPTQDNFFRAKSDEGIHYGHAGEKEFGAVKSQQLETSNVDSTTEFANIVVLQRMFQACSQIMEIDKELLQELENKS